MASLNVLDKWWVDVRRDALIRLLKDKERADGAALSLWRVGFEYWKNDRQLIPKSCFDLMPCAQELIQVGLAIPQAEPKHSQADSKQCLDVLGGAWVYVKGSGENFEWFFKKVAAGKKGGAKSALRTRDSQGRLQAKPKQTPSTSKPLPLPLSLSLPLSLKKEGSTPPDVGVSSTPEEKSNLWDFYETEWKRRYPKAELIRNAGTNSKMKQIRERIPKEHQEPLIQFYLKSDNPFYKDRMHQVGPLLMDCEKLVSEMTAGITNIGYRPLTKSQVVQANNDDFMSREIERDRREQEERARAASN
jgi:hypothetical protein